MKKITYEMRQDVAARAMAFAVKEKSLEAGIFHGTGAYANMMFGDVELSDEQLDEVLQQFLADLAAM